MTNFMVTGIVAVVGFAVLSVVFAGIWVYKDAKQRGLQAKMWLLLVLLSGNFIGLLLYLLIGRKQERILCSSCGAATDKRGMFCSACGEKIDMENRMTKPNPKLLFACVTCIVLVFAALGMCVHSYFTADGFSFQRQYSYYRIDSNGSAKNVNQKSSGDTWDLSFAETSSGYTFAKTYNAVARPLSLSVDIDCDGFVQLIMTQDGVSINETIGEGVFNYDMEVFGTGKINIKLMNIDASNFSGKMIIETEN